MTIISLDTILVEVIKQNMITILFIYLIVRQVFPNNLILKAIGDAFSATFGKLVSKITK